MIMITFPTSHPEVKAEDLILLLAYRILDARARDLHVPVVRRAHARASAVPLHRLLLMARTDADGEVDAGGYLRNTLDTAATTSAALLESNPLDTQPLSNGN